MAKSVKAKANATAKPKAKQPVGAGNFGPVVSSKDISPTEAASTTDETVLMLFPRPVVLQTNDGNKIHFPAGVNPVAKELVGHDWLRRWGVTVAGAKSATAITEAQQTVAEATLEFERALANLNAAKARENAASRQHDSAVAAQYIGRIELGSVPGDGLPTAKTPAEDALAQAHEATKEQTTDEEDTTEQQ